MAMSIPAFQAECQDCTGYGFLRLISGIVILLVTPGGTYIMEKRLEYLDGPECLGRNSAQLFRRGRPGGGAISGPAGKTTGGDANHDDRREHQHLPRQSGTLQVGSRYPHPLRHQRTG